jgi:DNA-binding transcriptional ArsR family regulator
MLSNGCPSVLKALSDEVRWRIVHTLLNEGQVRVTDLAAKLDVAQPTISKHLRILRNAGIVVSEKEGTIVWCRVTPDFRQRLRNGKQILDLGCCTFRFDQPQPS